MKTEINIADVTVAIGMPVAKQTGIPPATAMSMFQTMKASAIHGMDIVPILQRAGSAVVGRDRVVTTFLTALECDKLFWIDSDVVFTPADFFKMVALSTIYPVVCAAYPAKNQPTVRFQGLWLEDMTPNEHGLIEIDGTGLGFTIVDRKVLEQLADKCSMYENGGVDRYSMFRMEKDGVLKTEDIVFFSDVKKLGYKVMLNPYIELGHVGEYEWRGKFINALEKKNG